MSLPRLSNKESRKISKWLDADPLPPMRWGPRRERSSRRLEQTRLPSPQTEFEWINVKKILLPKREEMLDLELVSSIAESISVFGQLHPIAVRRIVEKRKGGGTTVKIVLVTGAHRLEAVKWLGREKVPCVWVDGDETVAQIVQLGEDIWRKRLTVLQHAEKITQYFTIMSAKLNNAGQLDQKSRVGRAPGGVALAARELPIIGRSVDARRKIIERALKISRITPEAKKTATKAGLADKQGSLLKIAAARGHRAQLKLIAEMAQIPARSKAGVRRAAKARDRISSSRSAEKTTTFDEWLALWQSDRLKRKKWAYLPARDRERFIAVLRRARQCARADVIEFVKNVFQGREKVYSQDLFGLATTHGFGKTTIQKALRAIGYRKKRRGGGAGSEWLIMNSDRNWKEQLRIFPDAELAAAGEGSRDARNAKAEIANGKRAQSMAEYLADD